MKMLGSCRTQLRYNQAGFVNRICVIYLLGFTMKSVTGVVILNGYFQHSSDRKYAVSFSGHVSSITHV